MMDPSSLGSLEPLYDPLLRTCRASETVTLCKIGSAGAPNISGERERENALSYLHADGGELSPLQVTGKKYLDTGVQYQPSMGAQIRADN